MLSCCFSPSITVIAVPGVGDHCICYECGKEWVD